MKKYLWLEVIKLTLAVFLVNYCDVKMGWILIIYMIFNSVQRRRVILEFLYLEGSSIAILIFLCQSTSLLLKSWILFFSVTITYLVLALGRWAKIRLTIYDWSLRNKTSHELFVESVKGILVMTIYLMCFSVPRWIEWKILLQITSITLIVFMLIAWFARFKFFNRFAFLRIFLLIYDEGSLILSVILYGIILILMEIHKLTDWYIIEVGCFIIMVLIFMLCTYHFFKQLKKQLTKYHSTKSKNTSDAIIQYAKILYKEVIDQKRIRSAEIMAVSFMLLVLMMKVGIFDFAKEHSSYIVVQQLLLEIKGFLYKINLEELLVLLDSRYHQYTVYLLVFLDLAGTIFKDINKIYSKKNQIFILRILLVISIIPIVGPMIFLVLLLNQYSVLLQHVLVLVSVVKILPYLFCLMIASLAVYFGEGVPSLKEN